MCEILEEFKMPQRKLFKTSKHVCNQAIMILIWIEAIQM